MANMSTVKDLANGQDFVNSVFVNLVEAAAQAFWSVS